MIAKKIGCSGRNLDRYLRVLQTSEENQVAFSVSHQAVLTNNSWCLAELLEKGNGVG